VARRRVRRPGVVTAGVICAEALPVGRGMFAPRSQRNAKGEAANGPVLVPSRPGRPKAPRQHSVRTIQGLR
jgi:hypothetical protein